MSPSNHNTNKSHYHKQVILSSVKFLFVYSHTFVCTEAVTSPLWSLLLVPAAVVLYKTSYSGTPLKGHR